MTDRKEKTRVPIARPHLTALENEYVNSTLNSQWITQGYWVETAEAKLCALTGRKYTVCCSSGTTALQVAILALQDRFRWRTSEGEKRSPRVAVPTLTFAAVFNAVELAHCQPVYLGVDKDTWQSPIYEWWRVLRNVDCFIAAPCYGMLGPMGAIEGLAKNSGMPFIEDCSESFTGSLGNRKAGSFGDLSICSFFANKVACSGEGGAIFTDDETLAIACRQIINHGVEKRTYRRVRVGVNGRLTDLAAAVLTAQLERLPEMLNRRAAILSEYRRVAVGWQLPKLPLMMDYEETPAPWLFCGVPPPRKIVNDSLAVVAERLNIETRPVFPCGHQPYSGFFPVPKSDHEPLKIAEEISHAGIVLPLSSAMSDEEVERVVSLIRSVA